MLETVLTLLTGGLSLIVLLAFVRLVNIKRHFTYKPMDVDVAEPPTLSVCIPARNETHAMTECLQRLLASDYPKLEIIVLDDGSVDDTLILIKSFAHAGVRFVEGTPLPDGWLGKNHALETLLHEASGSYILYMDVDTVVQPGTVSRLMETVLGRNLDLVSVLPQRRDGARVSVLFGTLRYFWIVFLESRKRPAVSSAAWLVRTDKLLALGGFEKYKNLVQPECYVLRDLRTSQQSHFFINQEALGVTYEKKWSSQLDASIRLLRPTFGGAFVALLVAFLLLNIVVVPFLGFMSSNTVTLALAVGHYVFVSALAGYYYRIAWTRLWWIGMFMWPLIILQEAWLILVSVIGYARGTITWKGRPIQNDTRTK